MAEKEMDMLARLEEVLDIYGSDDARWPARERQALKRFTETDSRAARLFTEAQALDHVLAVAPTGKASPGLASQIVAAAVADGTRGARVVPITAARARQHVSPGRASLRPFWIGPAAALLAACFSFGIYLGTMIEGTSVGATFETAAFGSTADEADELFGLDENGSDQGGLL